MSGKPEQQEPRPGYEAHKQIIPRMAMLQVQTEDAEQKIEEQQQKIEEHLADIQAEREKATEDQDADRLEELDKEERQLRAAYESLSEGLGRMTYGTGD